MSLTAIVLRVLFTYVFLLAIIRISGKRTLAQGGPFDFIVALVLGDMIDDMIWAEVPASVFVVGTGTLLLTHTVLTWAGSVSPLIERIMEGVPRDIVLEGEPQQEELRSAHLSKTDLHFLLRTSGIDDMREVRAGTVELSGEPGILKRIWAKHAQKKDLERVKEARDEGHSR